MSTQPYSGCNVRFSEEEKQNSGSTANVAVDSANVVNTLFFETQRKGSNRPTTSLGGPRALFGIIETWRTGNGANDTATGTSLRDFKKCTKGKPRWAKFVEDGFDTFLDNFNG
ncbi:hypothetical protein AMTR_s00141p00046560 [Amborella trichopoda]|uniref:Uncharacterized protein n=1 Tax=Amborella trichopoda TaxID=13333 RepID=W1PG93_AMBTC|nr:hypothetical protein AMTR_s00141p00046560 [Amborella trichopoda]